MVYKIRLLKRAKLEIEDALEYYSLHSNEIPKKFKESIQAAFENLTFNPFYQIRYKNIRSVKVGIFPFCLYFTVNESIGIVRIISCYHGKRNPSNRPRI